MEQIVKAAGSLLQGNYTSDVAQFFINLVTFWILYSYLVPISLFVTMEIVKFWQVRTGFGLAQHMSTTVSTQLARWTQHHEECCLNLAAKPST
jgi:hypothetical protein